MLDPKKKYLQIALNGTLNDAHAVINQIPLDERIIIEAGTPLIKHYGIAGIRNIRAWWEQRICGYQFDLPGQENFNLIKGSLMANLLMRAAERAQKSRQVAASEKRAVNFSPYIVADMKCMDRGSTEVQLAKRAGANAITALGHAPIETLDAFIEECQAQGIDSMIDMMNFEFPLNILRGLKTPPTVVMLHRGVDEEAFDPESEIPYHEIQRIKSEYDIIVAVAGGDDFREVQRARLNDADIVVVWKSFYQTTGDTAKIAEAL